MSTFSRQWWRGSNLWLFTPSLTKIKKQNRKKKEKITFKRCDYGIVLHTGWSKSRRRSWFRNGRHEATSTPVRDRERTNEFRLGLNQLERPNYSEIGVEGQIWAGIGRFSDLVEGRRQIGTDGTAVLVRQLDRLARFAVDVSALKHIGIKSGARILMA